MGYLFANYICPNIFVIFRLTTKLPVQAAPKKLFLRFVISCYVILDPGTNLHIVYKINYLFVL